MARNAEGWKLREKRGVFYVRFTHKGERYAISTRSRDSTEASTIAAKIYSDVIGGLVRKASTGKLAHPTMTIEELAGEWIANIEVELKGKTPDTYMVYAKHWKRHFETIGKVGSSSIGDYQRERLKEVQKSTVVKERSALLRFLVWLDEKGYIASVPHFPRIGKKVLGTRFRGGRRRSSPQAALSREWVDKFLGALDARSEKHGFLIRPRFAFAYATALRPGLIDQITWDDVIDGGQRLFIRRELDKEGKERKVRLSPMAQRALRDAGPPVKGQPIFGRHDYREHVARAKALLPPELAREFTPYGLKHARVTEWFRQGKAEIGIQHLTGTKWALGRYALASEEAADEIVSSD